MARSNDFDLDIGAPEHKLAILGKPYKRSFDALKEDLRALCIESEGVFNTISEKMPFIAKMLNDGGITFHDDQNKCDIEVTADELYEAWFMLINGPLSEQRLVGGASIAANYLLFLLIQRTE